MSIDFRTLKARPRILIEAALKPAQGARFQPTGFPDLGPATYDAPDGNGGVIPTLLIESAQSMANRLEAVCWDEGNNTIAESLKGLPYVKVKLAGLGDGTDTTTSLQEFHRLNSPYIMSGVLGGQAFADVLKPELGMTAVAKPKKTTKKAEGDAAPGDATTSSDKESDDVAGVVNLRKLATVCFKYDPNSLVHGIFLEKIAGRLRHPRALSAFVEASGVDRADSGGVKFDRVNPSKDPSKGITAEHGYTNVPFHRTEFTAQSITAYFSIDLAQIRGYGLPEEATELLIALSLWKVRQFLDSNMRLRTACELELTPEPEENAKHKRKPIDVKKPPGWQLPSTEDCADSLKTLIDACGNSKLFAEPRVTELTWKNG